MGISHWSAAAFAVLVAAISMSAEEPEKRSGQGSAAVAVAVADPLNAGEPVLRVDPEGPAAAVTSLAFSPDGTRLYAAGMDKLVHVWLLNKAGKFEHNQPLRVPIGPGHEGVLNAMAIEPEEGRLLAVAGRGLTRDSANFRQPGIMLPRLGGRSVESLEDEGTVYVFDTITAKPRALRGHRGPVLALAFAPARKGKAPLLVSLGNEDLGGKTPEGVIRIWDLDPKQEDGKRAIANLKGLPALLPESGSDFPRFGLAAWHTGDGLQQLRVALALGDGNLRFWDASDPDSQNKPLKVPSGEGSSSATVLLDHTVVYLPEQDRLVTGLFDMKSPQGLLQRWSAPVKGEPRKELKKRIVFPSTINPRRFLVPRAFTAFPLKPGQVQNHLAVALQVREPAQEKESFELGIINMSDDGWTEKGRISLWPMRPGQPPPMLASSPRGLHVAVAGNVSNVIRVYTIEGLLTEKNASPQELRSVGASFTKARFVAKDKAMGLHLSGPISGGDGARSLIFDLAGRRLAADQDDWKTDEPDLNGWKVVISGKPGAFSAEVRRDSKLIGNPVRLDKSQDYSIAAVLPPCPPLNVPILALAVRDRGEPRLGLYNVATGEQLRQLTGHLFTINSLAFSSKGDRLVSTAEDQTVCVWKLDDLANTLGKISLLRGIPFRTKDNMPIVGEFENENIDKENVGKLHPGDKIEGIVVKGKTAALENALALYHAIAVLDPKTPLILSVKGAAKPVALKLSQGIDERKPLFSVFVKPGKEKEQAWIGWNPLGNYDYSDPTMESYLTWHFNTGKTTEPVRIGDLKDYRKLYSKGLVDVLMHKGEWEPPIQGPPPIPVLNFKLAETSKPPRARTTPDYLVEGPNRITVPISPVMVMTIPNVDANLVEKAEWWTSRGHGELFKADAEFSWRSNLTTANWKRGEDEIKVVVRFQPGKTDQPEYTRKFAVLYLPPPPTVELGKNLPDHVEDDTYTLKARIEVSSPDEKAVVRVFHTFAGKEILVSEKTINGDTEPEWKITLRKGANRLRVVAENQGPLLKGHEQAERDWREHKVDYKALAPRIILARLELKDGNDIDLVRHEIGTSLSIDVPRFQLVGRIESKDELTEAAITVGAKVDKLDGVAGKKLVAIDREVTLASVPDNQDVRIVARTKNGQEQVILKVKYVPRLPGLVITKPTNGSKVLWDPKMESVVHIVGKLSWPKDDPQPGTAHVFVKGKEQGKSIDLKPTDTDFTADAQLIESGENVIQVRLSNKAGQTATTEPVVVHYRRAPVLSKEVSVDRKGERAFVTLKADVVTPGDLPLLSISLNGVALPPAKALSKGATSPAGVTTWTVLAEDVPLQPGNNRLQMRVTNQDGFLEPPPVTINGVKAEPPDWRILAPGRDIPVTGKPRIEISYSVQSTTPLTSVTLLRNGETLVEDVKAAGQFEYQANHEVTLIPGDNFFEVTAVNQRGKSVPQSRRLIRYLATPVVLEITAVSMKNDKDEKRILPTGRDGRTLLFPSSKSSQIYLHGQVRWSEEQDAQMSKTTWVHLYVNGNHYLPVRLTPGADKDDARVKQFRTEVTLRKEVNQLSVFLPDLPTEFTAHNLPDLAADAVAPAEARLACSQLPEDEVRRAVHLLIIGSKNEARDKLTKRVLESLGGQQATARGRFSMKGYVDGGIVYGPINEINLVDKLTAQYVTIGENLRERVKLQADADVVIVYYEGWEKITAAGNLLNPGANPGAATLSSEDLRKFIAQMPGTHILFLDVLRDNKDVARAQRDFVTVWPVYPHVAVLRYAWQDNPRQGDSRLLDDLNKAFDAKKSLLKDVTDYLRVVSKSSGERLLFSLRQPPSLENFPLGR